MPDATRATYRLQLSPDFTFDDAAFEAQSLAALGISHLYLSPAMTPQRGSTHGYDVADPATPSPELGGWPGWRRLVDAAQGAGLRLLLDTVPNHLVADTERNSWWRDVLEDGRQSPWADLFDVDWESPEPQLCGRVLVPVLDAPVDERLGDLGVERWTHGLCLRWYDHRLPLSLPSVNGVLAEVAADVGSPNLEGVVAGVEELLPATTQDDREMRQRERLRLTRRLLAALAEDPMLRARLDTRLTALDDGERGALLDAQSWLLAPWRETGARYNVRRFFTISTLVGVREEDPTVFAAMHAGVEGLVRSGDVHGLRIDHVDGLRDPAGYLRRLATVTRGTWTVVEKILEAGEELPADWLCAGTTGYELAALLATTWTPEAARAAMRAIRDELAGAPPPFAEVAAAASRSFLDGDLATDLARLVRAAGAAVAAPAEALHSVLRALLVHLPVYRTYADPLTGAATAADRHALTVAREAALAEPGVDGRLLDALVRLLGGEGWDGDGRAALLSGRFQQLAPAVMAKGLEDTALYRDTALPALCEVGCSPDRPAVGPREWHAWCAARAERHPLALLLTSSHDTKRGEDVRARLCALAERPDAWRRRVDRLRLLGHPHRDGRLDAATELHLLQTAVAAWPITPQRLSAYAEKSVREAALHTSWTEPDAGYEEALHAWITGLLGDADAVHEIAAAAAEIAGPALEITLAWTLLKMTAPGVPDIYWGNELQRLDLVDPDNRRPVDHRLRDRLLPIALLAGPAELLAGAADGLAKLAVVARALDLRNREPHSFDSGATYRPLAVDGAPEHVIAFARGRAGEPVPRVVAVVTRLPRSAGPTLASATVELPTGSWHDLFSDGRLDGGPVAIGRLLADFPVALLERAG